MARYDMQCKECGTVIEVSIPIKQFDELMPLERKKPCTSCGKENCMSNQISQTLIVYRGDGWTGLIGSSGSQSRVDAALAENDRLQDAVKTDKKYRKRDDEFRRMEEKAQNMAVKANG